MTRGVMSRRQFIWLFCSYLMIMLAGLILVNALFFGSALNNSRERAIQAQADDAYALKERIDAQLERITRVYSRMGDLHWVVKLSTDKPNIGAMFDSVDRLHVINELRTYTADEAFAGQTMLIFPGQNTIVSSSGWMPIADYLSLIGLADERELIIDSIARAYSFEAIAPDKLTINGRPCIWLMHTPNRLAAPGLQFVFLIDKALMAERLKTMFESDICAVSIKDGYGRQLNLAQTSNDADREITLNARYFDWKYTIALSAPEVMLAPSDFVFLLISLAIFALAGPFLAYGLARVSYRPLDMLMAKVGPAPIKSGVGEYAQLERYIDQISTDNKQMAQKLDDYQEAAEQDVLMRLLHGYFDLESIDKLHWFGFPYTEETAFAVMVVSPARTQSKPERDRLLKLALSVSLYMERALKEYAFDFRVYPFYEESTVVVLSDNDGRLTDNAVCALADGFIQSVAGESGARLDVFCGHTQLGILGISISYQQAKELINARLFAAPDKANDVQLNTAPRFYYPTDWEIQLINNLKIANFEASERILREIQLENDKQGLTQIARDALLRAVGETIRRVATELNLIGDSERRADSEVFEHMPESGDWHKLFTACRAICERTAYSHSESMEISARMVEYVTINYADAEISLKKLAEQFGLSASTISNIFKLNAGINFYDFLSRLRMEQAKALLRDTDDLVRDVGRAVGYENEHSFRRAFIRYLGVAPADYRKSAREGE